MDGKLQWAVPELLFHIMNETCKWMVVVAAQQCEHATKLYIERWLKWHVLCYIYFSTIKNKNNNLKWCLSSEPKP